MNPMIAAAMMGGGGSADPAQYVEIVEDVDVTDFQEEYGGGSLSDQAIDAAKQRTGYDTLSSVFSDDDDEYDIDADAVVAVDTDIFAKTGVNPSDVMAPQWYSTPEKMVQGAADTGALTEYPLDEVSTPVHLADPDIDVGEMQFYGITVPDEVKADEDSGPAPYVEMRTYEGGSVGDVLAASPVPYDDGTGLGERREQAQAVQEFVGKITDALGGSVGDADTSRDDKRRSLYERLRDR